MFNLKKNGFTLAETIIVCSLFAVMVVGIIFGINRAFIFLNNTRLQVIATNFAREGVEMVYNMRDTNRRKYPGDRDKHWMWKGTGESNLQEGIYVIKEGLVGGSDSYVYAEKLGGVDSENFYTIEGFFDESNSELKEDTELVFTGSYSYNSGGNIITGGLDELMDSFGFKFYRILRVYGVFCKNSNNANDTSSCSNDSDPKELRFCVKVFYEGSTGKHAIELCSLMTNFME